MPATPFTPICLEARFRGTSMRKKRRDDRDEEFIVGWTVESRALLTKMADLATSEWCSSYTHTVYLFVREKRGRIFQGMQLLASYKNLQAMPIEVMPRKTAIKSHKDITLRHRSTESPSSRQLSLKISSPFKRSCISSTYYKQRGLQESNQKWIFAKVCYLILSDMYAMMYGYQNQNSDC